MYVNYMYIAGAVAVFLMWGRFLVWIDNDLPNMPEQPAFLWKGVLLGSLVILMCIWLLVANFWFALILSIFIPAALLGYYWRTRVAVLGSSGNLLGVISGRLSQLSAGRQAKKSVAQLGLRYEGKGGRPLHLPAVEDPAYNGVVLLDQLLIQGLENRAQRIDLMPSSQAYETSFTTDGVVYPQSGMQRSNAEPLIHAVKLITGLSLEERRRPQSAVFTTRDADNHPLQWTASTSGTTAGERLWLQCEAKDNWKMPLDHLGMSSEQLTSLREALIGTDGLFIVTAPTHMGRTTTLYSLLGSHDAYTTSMNTLEIHPRADFDSITVTRFDPSAENASHAKTLQSLMLKDPHILMVAQCPDAATAALIAKYSMEDHRVYLGLRANDTIAALELWRKVLPDNQVAAAPLRAIIAQRLVRLLCPTCKIAYQSDEALLAKLNLPIGRDLSAFKANTQPSRDPKGNVIKCPDCASLGYRGQTGIFEILVINDDIRRAIATGRSAEEIRTLARKNNMMFLVEHGFRKFAMGLTSIQEVIRVCTAGKKSGATPKTAAAGSRAGVAKAGSSGGAVLPGESGIGGTRSGGTTSAGAVND
ncbi:MAG: ATPase, T2SS/T4P/T4SS family [Planctomycetia bacterium]|nr:ATPase, T2SS/T4P/T4SS family [Planctomycetia bacterium]